MNFDKRRMYLFFLPLLAVLVVGCSQQAPPEPEAPPDYPVEINATKILERPQSVVTLSPSLTQTLIDLGLEGRIVGVSDYCTPPELPKGEEYHYTRCGAPQAPEIGTLRRVAPDVVLTPAPMSNDQLTRLQQENIDVVVIPPATTIEELRRNYTDIFRVLFGEEEGKRRAEESLRLFDAKVEDIRTRASGAEESGKLAVYITADLLTVATGDTLEGELMELLGLENAAKEYTDYVYPKDKEVDLNPDVILSSGLMDKEIIVSSSCYKSTPAIKNEAFYEIDGTLLESQSPSMLYEIWKLGEALYPEAFYVEPPPDLGY